MQDTNSGDVARPHILICDDDAGFSAELAEGLSARGYAATAFLSMPALRATLLAPTTLVLDICMPAPDGFEILAMLARHPRKAQFRIILVSGWNERVLGMAAALCHAHALTLLGTLSKPVSVRALCDLLEADQDAWD
jgi:CheY-like chemotaxis protein